MIDRQKIKENQLMELQNDLTKDLNYNKTFQITKFTKF